MFALSLRREAGLLVVAIAAGWLFFSSLGRLWPLVGANLVVPAHDQERTARTFLAGQGFDLRGYVGAGALVVDEAGLDYVENTFGRARTQQWLRTGLPLATYAVMFKRAGRADWFGVSLSGDGKSVAGWSRFVQEDEAAPFVSEAQARRLVRSALRSGLGLDLSEWRAVGVSTRVLPARTDHVFTFERTLSRAPELKERASARVAGNRVVSAGRTVIAPASAARAARAADAPRQALFNVGTLLFAGAVFGAFWVFLDRLRDGSVRLGQAALWSGVVFVLALATNLLQNARLLSAWDPLWPWWIALLQYVVNVSQANLWTFAVLVAVVAAGDALDRQASAGRGLSLWLLSQGRIWAPSVGAASLRGFLLGLICGGVMAATVLLLENLGVARTALQPRGFFFYALNSSAPAASTLLYFANIALLEELGYRYFAGTWLLQVTRRPWLAIFLPALVYGLTHTTLTFLPPAEPFWARALVMTLVGCVWGWAFLRYDALTVVLSHFSSDLFIFNWPRLASGDPALVITAVLTIMVPLLPALAWSMHVLLARARRRTALPSPAD